MLPEWTLPLDILESIVDQIGYDVPSHQIDLKAKHRLFVRHRALQQLSRLSLVCKALLNRCRHWIFHSVKIAVDVELIERDPDSNAYEDIYQDGGGTIMIPRACLDVFKAARFVSNTTVHGAIKAPVNHIQALLLELRSESNSDKDYHSPNFCDFISSLDTVQALRISTSGFLFSRRIALLPLEHQFGSSLQNLFATWRLNRLRLDYVRISPDFFQILPSSLEPLALWRVSLTIDSDVGGYAHQDVHNHDQRDEVTSTRPLARLKDEFYCVGLAPDLTKMFIDHVVSTSSPNGDTSLVGMFSHLKRLTFQYDGESSLRGPDSHLLEAVLVQSGHCLEKLRIMWDVIPEPLLGPMWPPRYLDYLSDLNPHNRLKRPGGAVLNHFDGPGASILPLESLHTFQLSIKSAPGTILGTSRPNTSVIGNDTPAFIHLHLANPRIWNIQNLEIDFSIHFVESYWLGQFEHDRWYDFNYTHPATTAMGYRAAIPNSGVAYRPCVLRDDHEDFVTIDHLLADPNAFSKLTCVKIRVFATAVDDHDNGGWPGLLDVGQFLSRKIAEDVGNVFCKLEERMRGKGGELIVRVNGWDCKGGYDREDSQKRGVARWIHKPMEEDIL